MEDPMRVLIHKGPPAVVGSDEPCQKEGPEPEPRGEKQVGVAQLCSPALDSSDEEEVEEDGRSVDVYGDSDDDDSDGDGGSIGGAEDEDMEMELGGGKVRAHAGDPAERDESEAARGGAATGQPQGPEQREVTQQQQHTTGEELCQCGVTRPTLGRPFCGGGAKDAVWCKLCPGKPADTVSVLGKRCVCGRDRATLTLVSMITARWCPACPDKPEGAMDLSAAAAVKNAMAAGAESSNPATPSVIDHGPPSDAPPSHRASPRASPGHPQQLAPQGMPGLLPAPCVSWDDMTRAVERRGVTWQKSASKWRAVTSRHLGSQAYLGQYTSEAAAMRTYDRVALAANAEAETNFPPSDYAEEELARLRSLPLDEVISMAKQHLLAGDPRGEAADDTSSEPGCTAPVMTSAEQPAATTSSRVVNSKGVRCLDNKWVVNVHYQGKTRYLGAFTSRTAAMRTYDHAALVLKPGAETNFPPSDYAEEELARLRSLPLPKIISMAKQHLLSGDPGAAPPLAGASAVKNPKSSSSGASRVVRRIGATWNKEASRWKAYRYQNSKNVHLGYFTSRTAAMRTYDRVALAVEPGAETNFPSSDYSEEELARLRSRSMEELISMAKQRLLAGSPGRSAAASAGAPVPQLALASVEIPNGAQPQSLQKPAAASRDTTRRGGMQGGVGRFSWSQRDSRWMTYGTPAVIGKNVYLGCFTKKAAAMRTYDRVALAVEPGAETNFPSSDYSEEELARLRSLPLDEVISMAKQHLLAGEPGAAPPLAGASGGVVALAHCSSEPTAALVPSSAAHVHLQPSQQPSATAREVKRKGVSWDKRDSWWKVTLQIHGRKYASKYAKYLGIFTSEAAAMRTYDRVALVAMPGAETNFPPSDYSEEELARLRSLPLDEVISRAKQHLLAGSPPGAASEGARAPQQQLALDSSAAESLAAITEVAAFAAMPRANATGISVGVQTEPAPPAAAATPDDPASFLGRAIHRSFYPPGSATPCWYEGRVACVRLDLGGDGRSVVPSWEVVYVDGDKEELGWEDLQAAMMPVAKRARQDE